MFIRIASCCAFVGVMLIAEVSHGQTESSKKPSALIAFEKARREIKTADIDWTLTNFNGRMKDMKRHRRSLLAGDDIAFFNHGTADGVTGINSKGDPLRLPSRNLVNRDYAWHYQPGKIFSDRWDRKDVAKTRVIIVDPRTIGMVPLRIVNKPVEEILWTYNKTEAPRKYSQKRVDGLYEVSMKVGEVEVKWYIDPDRGWNAVRSEEYYNGKKYHEARCMLKKFGDVWFPAAVEYFVNDFDSPVMVVEVPKASFNRPEHPRRLTASHIGLEPGMSVTVSGAGEEYAYTGERAVPIPEYDRLKKKHGIKVGPTILAFRARHRWQVLMTEWEFYAKSFIAEYKLDEKQSHSAMAIVKACQEKARKLAEPTDERVKPIFEKELKPRLRSLLNSKQAREAKKRDAQKKKAKPVAAKPKKGSPPKKLLI